MSASYTTPSNQLNVVSKVAARLVIGVGILVLVGWSTGQMALVGIHSGWAATTPSTATALLMLGVSLLGVRPEGHDPARIKVNVILSGLVLLLGVTSLFQHFSGQNWAINRWWFGLADSQSGGLMSSATAWGVTFVSVGCLVSMFAAASRHWITSLMGLGSAAIGLTGLLDYLLRPDSLMGVPGFQTLAFPTAVALLLLGIGLIGAAEQNTLSQLLAHPGFQGVEVKVLLPLVLVLPPVLGWLVFVLGIEGALSFRNGIVSAAVIYVVIAGYMLWRTREGFDSARNRQLASDEALQKSEQWANLMVNSLPVAVWTCAPDGKCDYLSPQWIEYSGIPLDEQLGFGWLDVVHPDDRERVNREWMSAANSGTHLDTEYRLKSADGSYRWFQAMAKPRRSEQSGEITKWFGSSLDINSLKESRDELARSFERLEDLVALRTQQIEKNRKELSHAQAVARIGSWTYQRATDETNWSDELFRIFGMDSAKGAPNFKDQQNLFAPESWDTLTTAVQSALKTGEGYTLSLKIINAAGEERWTEAKGEIVTNSKGDTVGLTGTLQDITESQQLRTELEATSLRLQLAMSSAKIGVWRRNLSNETMIWDDTTRKIYGRDSAGVTTSEWLGMIAAEDRSAVETAINKALEDGAEYDHKFTINKTVEGQLARVRGRVAVLRDDVGAPIEMIGVSQDITAEWKSTQNLRKRESDLTRSNRDLQQFAYVASHDLQEPLRAVSGCVQLLQHRYAEKFDETGNTLVSHTVAGAKRMQDLINDLLAYSRIGSKDFVRKRTSISHPLRSALDNLSTSIVENNAVIDFPEELPTVMMDPSRITQLFQNLFSNALKYRSLEESPRIRVSVDQNDEEVEVSVEDNGIGIEERHAKKIFEIFQRLHTRSEYPGSGIGLALCARIMDRHGGRIWVDTDVSEGSVFKFTLPKI